MTLEELLGENYKEGITADEIKEIYKNQILGGGEYVKKEDMTAVNKKNEDLIKDLKKQLKDKMTDGEKTDTEKQDLLDKIAELEETNRNNKVQMSRAKAEGELNGIKSILELKENDKEFSELIENISGEDIEKSNKIGAYIAKIVNSAYEKGKAAATKTSLGEMGKMVVGEGGKLVDKEAQLAKELASMNTVPQFKNSNFI